MCDHMAQFDLWFDIHVVLKSTHLVLISSRLVCSPWRCLLLEAVVVQVGRTTRLTSLQNIQRKSMYKIQEKSAN